MSIGLWFGFYPDELDYNGIFYPMHGELAETAEASIHQAN